MTLTGESPSSRTARRDTSASADVRVATVGAEPWWLDHAAGQLGDLTITIDRTPAALDAAYVIHLAGQSIRLIPRLKANGQAPAIVVDLIATNPAQLRRRDLRDVALADLIVVGTRRELDELSVRHPALAGRIRCIAEPVDLTAFAPEQTLSETRARDLRLHRRRHRLAGPLVLYAGEYVEGGGLDLAIEAVLTLRDTRPELRLAALPLGRVDAAFRDRCERKALALGHHGIIEWTVEPTDVPLWFALAEVACLQAHRSVRPDAARLALASGTPVVAAALPPLTEFVEEGVTGFVVAPGELPATTDALATILAGGTAEGFSRASRERAERDLDPASAGRELAAQWRDVLELSQTPAAEAGLYLAAGEGGG
jgi:glycosyltransferase involved in cell wall biosynthesis